MKGKHYVQRAFSVGAVESGLETLAKSLEIESCPAAAAGYKTNSSICEKK